MIIKQLGLIHACCLLSLIGRLLVDMLGRFRGQTAHCY
jgi:hypothetical protein